MGVPEVRAAIVDRLMEPAIPGLTRVYRGLPVRFDDWPIGVDTGWGAGGYIHIGDIAESRIAFGGEHGGLKRVTYQSALVVSMRWLYADHGPNNQTDGWVDPLDELIADITTRIRSDRTLACGPDGPVWQAGEGENDIHTVIDDPREDEGQVVVWFAVEFEVVEMDQQTEANP